ncbi:peptidylprolyl isomerase [Terasakiella pusilla]|jgi:peptidyl-prolyl cis-trans isomerase SurA|uniref:peptidylprolyl isomerase n=1 Tax=Terasakiella pusilla TaxID=64973 RepID=UPI003AA908B0
MLQLIQKTKSAALIAFATLFFLQNPSYAQGVMRIAAVVNDDVISAHDLAQRVRLTIATSRIPDTPQVRSRLASSILRTMIDERMKLQAAESQGIEIKDDQIKSGLQRYAQSHKINPNMLEQALDQIGVDIMILEEQAEAEIAWSIYVKRMSGQRIAVSEQEVDAAMQQIEANKGKPEYNFAEIFLPVDTPSEEANARQMAERLLGHIQEGSSFEGLARDFSKSPSATEGGVLGWVQSGNIDPNIENTLERLPIGQYSKPVRTPAGYYLLKLNDKRISGQETADEILDLGQIVLPYNSPETKAQAQQNAQYLAQQIQACETISQVAQQVPGAQGSTIENVKMSTTLPALRETLANVQKGQITFFERPNALMVIMVCDRRQAAATAEPEIAKRREIENRLRLEKIGREERRLLQQERRSAFVDIRL